MDLVKKFKKIEIDGEEYLLGFDMKSIVRYKEITGESFNKGTHKLFNYDDEALLNFISCTLRKSDRPEIIIEKEFVEENALYFLLNHINDVIEVIVESLPKGKNSKKK